MKEQIGFLGPAGSFGWKVADTCAVHAKLVPYSSHGLIIKAVATGEVTEGVVARENSIGGGVADTQDPLIGGLVGIEVGPVGEEIVYSSCGAMICKEFVLPIRQCLYLPASPSEVVKRVYSHPQGIVQCTEFIAQRFLGAECVAVSSTVAGVERLQEDAAGVAIAPPWAIDFYPEATLAEKGIQDQEGNATRFLVLGKEDARPSGRDRTSICFTVPGDEEPGSFDRVSQIFASCRVNKRVIESRPKKTELGVYVFLVDIDGHREDPVIRLALELIVMAGLTTTLTILGSYPRWQDEA